jgi:hypothetical protein
VLGNVQHLASKALSDTLLNMSDEDQNFQAELMPVLSALILEQGQLALEFSGAGQDAKYTISQSITNAISARTKKMSQNFDQETLDQLNNTLNEGLQNGEGLDALSARVSDVYSTAQGYRADRIARTESQASSNAATLDAYKQNPVVTSMTWLANPGACEFCGDLDGTTVGLETSFVNAGDSVDVSQEDGSTDSYQANYGDVETPPLHPNCTCTIIPVTGN